MATPIKAREKVLWFLAMASYFTAGYLTINWVSRQRTHFFDVSVAADFQIPFVPVFIFGYILVYLSVVLVCIVVRERVDWHRTLISFFIASSLAYVFFLLFPVHMTMRPDLSGQEGISLAATRLYYLIDLPYNCFPSLHVTYPTLAALVAWRGHPLMRWVFLTMAVAVAVSVLFVKQHYIADVLAGFINALISFWLALLFYRKEKGQAPSRGV